MSFGKSWRQERPMGEEVKWQESVVDAGKAPCWHCANGSRGQWQSPHHLSLQIPAEQERSSNGVLQMSDPEPPTCRVATSCHPALVFVPPKTVCVQETNAGVLGLARPEDNEGWLYPRRIEDGRCLLHPLRWCQYCLLILENTSNIPSVFSMHDALYSSVDWLLTGPDAGCIPLQWPCHAPTTSSRIAENLQEASTHLCTPPKNFSASSLRFREDERGANSGRGLERKNIRPEDPGEDPLTPHILYPTPRQLRTIYHFQINSLNFKPNPSFIIALLDSLDFSSQPCVKMSSSTSSSPTSPTWTTPTPTSTTTTTTTSTWQRKLQGKELLQRSHTVWIADSDSCIRSVRG
ncbi:hypothetical protein EV426DRAFT_26182 [Tirmania nivea]|nr:hypothetical protein EV426DRAFT_26182 [Tirmania nivea]